MLKQSSKGLIASIRICPNSKKNEIIREKDYIKIKITAQPIDGKANKCLVEYLSNTFKIPKTSIHIIKGETSKDKTVLFETDDNQKLEYIKLMLQ